MTHHKVELLRSDPAARAEKAKLGELAMQWHGWGSPVGLAIFVLAVGASVAAIAYAFGADGRTERNRPPR